VWSRRITGAAGTRRRCRPPAAGQAVRPVIDELGYDLVDVPGVSVEETVFESLEPGSG
jgi:hypothetical protein